MLNGHFALLPALKSSHLPEISVRLVLFNIVWSIPVIPGRARRKLQGGKYIISSRMNLLVQLYIYMNSLIIDYACCFSQTMKNKHEAGKDCCLSYLFDLIDIRMIHGLEMVIWCHLHVFHCHQKWCGSITKDCPLPPKVTRLYPQLLFSELLHSTWAT